MSALSDRVRGNWNIVKGKIKEEYGEITDNDLQYSEGQEDQMIGRLQRKMGKTKQEVIDYINSL